MGEYIGDIKGDTRTVDYNSHIWGSSYHVGCRSMEYRAQWMGVDKQDNTSRWPLLRQHSRHQTG